MHLKDHTESIIVGASISLLWLYGPIAWVVHADPDLSTTRAWTWFLGSKEFGYLLLLPCMPIMHLIGSVVYGRWIEPYFTLRRNKTLQQAYQETTALKAEIEAAKAGLAAEKQAFEIEVAEWGSRLEVRVHQVRVDIEAEGMKDRVRRQMAWDKLSEDIQKRRREAEKILSDAEAAQKQAREHTEKLKTQDISLQARAAELERREAALKVLQSEISSREKNLADRQKQLDHREHVLEAQAQAKADSGLEIENRDPEDLKQEPNDFRTMDDFIADCCSLRSEKSTKSFDLYQAYLDWASGKGVETPMTSTRFGANLRARGLEPKKGTAGTRYWLGIDLKTRHSGSASG